MKAQFKVLARPSKKGRPALQPGKTDRPRAGRHTAGGCLRSRRLLLALDSKYLPPHPLPCLKERRSGKNLPKEQGLVLGCVGKKNAVTALVDSADIHCLMIGAPGVGKTAFFLYRLL